LGIVLTIGDNSNVMDAGSVSQVASAIFTASTATVAFLAMFQAKQQTQMAREALETQTQPLLADVPRGRLQEPVRVDARPGESTSVKDAGEIRVSASGDEPLCSVSVPIRNVGNGTARVNAITFMTPDGDIQGSVDSPVIPPREISRAHLDSLPTDLGSLAAESIAIERQNFSVLIDYSDASGRRRGSLRLDIANGARPHVKDRDWKD
jgi:hypothetical protein